MKKNVATMMVVILAFALVTLAGCGGGGGGGGSAVAPAPVSGPVSLLAKAAKLGDTAWGGNEISAQPGQTVMIHVRITNGTSASITPTTIITFPSGITFVAGSGQSAWSENGTDRSGAAPDAIATTAGASLGYSLLSGSYSFFDFSAQVGSVASGTKTITVSVNGVPATVNINVAGNAVCQAVTNPTCTANQHSVSHSDVNGCPVANTCEANTCTAPVNPSCETGTHSVSHPDVNGCPVANTCEANICQPVTNPTCETGTHRVSHPNDVNGCAVPDTCEADPVVLTGTLRVISNLDVASACVSGASSYCGRTEGGSWQATLAVGNYTLSCPAITNYTISTSQSILTGTLAANNMLTLNCAYQASGGTTPIGPGEPSFRIAPLFQPFF